MNPPPVKTPPAKTPPAKTPPADPNRIASKLSRNQFFSALTAEENAALVTMGVVEAFPAKATIFRKGDLGDKLYAVLSGQVEISVTSRNGKTTTLNILNVDAVLGEIAFLDGKERTADAHAVGRVELFRVDRRDFIAFIGNRPELALRMMKVLCDRLRWVSESMEDMLFLDVPRRLAKRLLQLAEQYGRPHPGGGVRITQPLSQEDLGALVGGVTREMINKTLTSLKKREIITSAKGSIVILDMDALRSLAD